jgi:hypothetical protein
LLAALISGQHTGLRRGRSEALRLPERGQPVRRGFGFAARDEWGISVRVNLGSLAASAPQVAAAATNPSRQSARSLTVTGQDSVASSADLRAIGLQTCEHPHLVLSNGFAMPANVRRACRSLLWGSLCLRGRRRRIEKSNSQHSTDQESDTEMAAAERIQGSWVGWPNVLGHG